jgi:hypothetical protein
MNEQDLRDCFAMFIVNGLISRASVFDMKEVWEIADAMLEARDPGPTVGLPPLKRRGRPRNDTRTN